MIAPGWGLLPRAPFAPEELPGLHAARQDSTAPQPAGVWNAVVARAEQEPGSPALRAGKTSWTYGELANVVSAVSGQLAPMASGDVVAIVGPRNDRTAIALLAAEATRTVSLLLPGHWPAARIERAITEAGARVAVLTGAVPEAVRTTVDLVVDLTGTPPAASAPRRPARAPDAPACLVRTAGPKTVVVTAQGMADDLHGRVTAFGLAAGDRVGATAPVTTRTGISQLLTGLLAGAETVVLDDETVAAPDRLAAAVDVEGITVLELPPSRIEALLRLRDTGWGQLRLLISTGTAPAPELIVRWQAASPGIPLVDAYSTAECGTIATGGTPAGSAELHVLDTRGPVWRACAPGETGELVVGGPGVGPGYLADDSRTRAEFYQDTVSGRPGVRLHRTGDLARVTPTGELRHAGRIDRQVSGLDLDLLETTLRGLPGLDDCAVLAANRARRLVARAVLDTDTELLRLVVFVSGARPPGETEVAAALAELLPAEVVLDEVVVTDELLRKATGGIDYARLAGRPIRAGISRPPETPEQERVCEVWAGVLGVDTVGIDDSFLALGGDSLQALRIIARLRASGSTLLTVRDVLLNDTPEKLATVLGVPPAETPPADEIEPRPASSGRPLSAHQEGVYFHWLMAPDSPYYSYQGTLHLNGPLDEPRLRRAWLLLLAENPSMLVRFAERDGRPVQHIPHWTVELGATVTPEADAQAQFDSVARELAERPFDLHGEPLVRTRLFRFAPDDHRLLVTMHEILLDGWGATVLFGRLGTLYAALDGEPDRAPDPDRRDSFVRYLRWQQQHHAGREVELAGLHWERSLTGVLPVLDLPTDHPRPAFPSFRGSLIEHLLAGPATRRLHERCAELGLTPFMLILAAFALTLTYHAGDDEIIIGVPMANRDTEQQVDVVGFLLNMLPLRVRTGQDQTVGDYLTTVQRTVLDGLAASDYPFSSVLRRLEHLPRTLDRAPVFQVMLNMLNYPVQAATHDDVEFRFVEMDTGFTKYDCALYVQPHGDTGLLLQLSYQTDLFDTATAKRWLAGVLVTIDALTGDAGARLGETDLLPANERRMLERFSTGG